VPITVCEQKFPSIFRRPWYIPTNFGRQTNSGTVPVFIMADAPRFRHKLVCLVSPCNMCTDHHSTVTFAFVVMSWRLQDLVVRFVTHRKGTDCQWTWICHLRIQRWCTNDYSNFWFALYSKWFSTTQFSHTGITGKLHRYLQTRLSTVLTSLQRFEHRYTQPVYVPPRVRYTQPV
jgi:hypothetical protein